jgi:putative membrane protein
MPAWHLHPDVLLLVGALGAAYAFAVRRLGPSRVHAVERAATKRQMAAFSAGLATMFVASYWPMHDLAEGHLYSAHMVQHMMLTLVAPPLLMLGTPAWLWRLVLGKRGIAVLARLTKPLIALALFNVMIAVSHIPAVVTLSATTELFHFTMHTLLFGTAVLMWSPVVQPLIELPKLSYPARMFYLFLQSLLPTVPASFLTFGHTVLYRVYDQGPHTFGISPITDQRAAGLIMKIVGGFLLWTVIAVYFFRWQSVEERENVDVLEWSKLQGSRDTGLVKR